MKPIHIPLVALLLSPALPATSILWGSAQDVTGALNEISTTGTSLGAWNARGGSSVVTVNGVSFSSFTPSGWTVTVSNALRPINTTAVGSSTTGDSGYDDILQYALAASGGSAATPTQTGVIQLDTLMTLVPGQAYEIQIWYNDQKSNGEIEDRVMTFGSSSGPLTILAGGIVDGNSGPGSATVSLEADPGNYTGDGDTAIGQYAIGTFTADTDPLYLLVQGTHPNSALNLRPHINAFQVRAIPEPSAVFLAVLAGGMTLIRRRR